MERFSECQVGNERSAWLTPKRQLRSCIFYNKNLIRESGRSYEGRWFKFQETHNTILFNFIIITTSNTLLIFPVSYNIPIPLPQSLDTVGLRDFFSMGIRPSKFSFCLFRRRYIKTASAMNTTTSRSTGTRTPATIFTVSSLFVINVVNPSFS